MWFSVLFFEEVSSLHRTAIARKPRPGASCARHEPWSLQQRGRVPQDPPPSLPGARHRRPSEERGQAVCLKGFLGGSLSFRGVRQATGMLYLATIVPSYFTLALVHILKNYYGNIQT